MESNVEINIDDSGVNSKFVSRCPLGRALNSNQESNLEDALNSKLSANVNAKIDSSLNTNAGHNVTKEQSHSGSVIVNKSIGILLKITGIIFVGLAILGVVLPILPTTPFLLVAAACFAKSSPAMQKKLLANKTFGPLIHDWQEYRSIPRKAKRIALLTIILSVCWSAFMLNNLSLTLLVIALVTGPFIFLWRLPLSK